MATDFAFLHGGTQGSWVWEETIAALRDVGGPAVDRCLGLDVPGCGTKRGADTAAMTFDDLVADLVADIDAAGLRDAVLVGHSQAGTVLPRLAEARAHAFRRLVYVSCAAPEPGFSVLAGSPRKTLALGQAPDVAVMMERYHAMMCNDMDPESALAFFNRQGADAWPASSYTYTEWRYGHLGSVASTYVHCLQDHCLPLERQKEAAARLHVGRTVDLEAGHQAMNSQPEALARLLLAEAG
jgi:pimeloyl-ACP methyl ester carboxylesterase